MSLLASLSAAFAARPDSAAVPAASVAVLVAGDEVTAAWGAPDGTLFQAASISKPVAALAALRLAAQGRLSLDVDVNEYLTSWRLPGGTESRRSRSATCCAMAVRLPFPASLAMSRARLCQA